MYSTLKPTIRFTRNTRCPCSNDCDDHGDFFSRHKAGPPDEPRVDGRWCNVQHQEHMTVQSSCTQNNMWIRHLFYKTKSGCRFGEKCSYAHRQVDEQPSQRSKKNDDKSAVAMLKKNDLHESVWQPVVKRDKSHERSGRPDINRDTCHGLKRGPVGRRSSNARQLGCVFQDMKPPKSILRKSSDLQKPIQRVKFTKAIARHTKIRDQNPSLGNICPGQPHQRSPNAPKLEDRSQEETEWQEQGAREAAWKLAKSVLK